jgi:hypothetical protein
VSRDWATRYFQMLAEDSQHLADDTRKFHGNGRAVFPQRIRTAGGCGLRQPFPPYGPKRHRDQEIAKLPSIWSVAPREVARSKIRSSAEAELVQIDENLVRANLSDAERILRVARRKELYEKLHPETKHGGDRRSARARSSSQNENLKAFVADIAVKTGKGRSTVARDVTRAKKVAVLDDIARSTRSASFPKASSASSRLQPGLARK